MQLTAALEYFLSNPLQIVSDSNDEKKFHEACGVGVHVTPEQIEKAVEEAIGKFKAEIIEKRYKFISGQLIAHVRQSLKWADGKAVKNEIDVQLLDLLGPKTEEDLNPKKAAKQETKPASTTAAVPLATKCNLLI